MIRNNKTEKANSMLIIGNKNKKELFDECNNMAFHDLTAHDNPSMEMKTFLGLSPKFCIQSRGFKIINIIRMPHMLKRDVRLQNYLMSNSFEEDEEIPRMCRRDNKWQPPKATGPIDDFLKKFETTMYL